MPLPAWWSPCRAGPELKQARLRAVVPLNLEGIGILPRDVQPPGQAHEVRGAVRAALLPGRLVAGRVPASPTFRPSALSGTPSKTPFFGVTIRHFQSSTMTDTQ